MDIKARHLIVMCIFILVSSTILLKSNYYSHGYLTADGCNYLSLAQNLHENGDFYVNAFAGEKERVFSAVWPVGYPTMIFLFSKVTGTSVFWASKLLNIFFVGAILILLMTVFPKYAYVYSFVLLLAPFMEIFSYTFSEVPFIFGMLSFSSIIHMMIKQQKVTFWYFILLTGACLLLFLSRYIGAFSVGFLSLLSLYYFIKRRNSEAFSMLLSAAIVSACVAFYLFNNYYQTGYITGMPRGSVPYVNLTSFVMMLIRALLSEVNLLAVGFGTSFRSIVIFMVTIVLQLFFYVYFIGRRCQIDEAKSNIVENGGIFILVGLFYYVAIISARLTSYMGNLDFRFMFPGTFLVLIGCITLLMNNGSANCRKQSVRFVFIVSLCSFIIGAGLPVVKTIITRADVQKYQSAMSHLIQNTDDIEKGSVVAFGDRNLAYLRTDLSIASPFYIPNFPEKESWGKFIERVKKKYPGRKVYVMLKGSNYLPSLDSEQLLEVYDETVVHFIQENKKRGLFQVTL